MPAATWFISMSPTNRHLQPDERTRAGSTSLSTARWNRRPSPAPWICPDPVPTTATCVGQSPVLSQAFLTFSDDRGLTWSQPAPIAPAVQNTLVKRLWPVVSVEPSSTVDVTYYQSKEQVAQDGSLCTVRVSRNPLIFRTGDAHSFVNTFWVQSRDGGVTFSAPLRISSATSDWCTTVSNITPNVGD